MSDQSSAASEHAIIQEVTAPLANLPEDPLPIAANADFPVALRGYDRLAVDAYVKKTAQLVAELQATRSPEAVVRRALERVGEEVAGVLQRAHDTAEEITRDSRREAEDRLEASRVEAANIVTAAEQRLRDLDAETDRIWAERDRIVEDARQLAAQLTALASEAAARFPAAEEESPEDGEDAEVASESQLHDEPHTPDEPHAPDERGAPDELAGVDDEAPPSDDAEHTAVMPAPPPYDHGDRP